MEQLFLPAIGPYITDNSRQWKRPIHWLDPTVPEIFYPWALASFALWRNSPLPFHGAKYFGDSGGYTQVTQPDYSASPTDVIKWQLKNCVRGVMFDLPPYRPGSAIQFSGSAAEWWVESLDLSMRNVRRALPIYEKHKQAGGLFRWWGVVQGESLDQMAEWHQKISEIYPFTGEGEGWALAPKPSTDLLSCTRHMRFAHDRGIRNVHLLQVTADRTVALILALGVMSGQFDLITYDSASALRCAINRSAIVPDGFGQKYIKESRAVQVDEECLSCGKIGTECQCPGNENTVHLMMMECPCQACIWYREIYPVDNATYPHMILLHNHLIMVESFRMTYAECLRDPDSVLRWATDKLYGDVLREWAGVSQAKPQRRPVSLLDRIARL